MLNALKAGILYFGIVFLVGFLLGIVRILFLVPQFGETFAVLTEIPFILGASWLVCGFVVRRLSVEAQFSSRLTMGVCAFGLLMIAEILLGVIGFGRTLDQQLAAFVSEAGFLGLAGQILFGLFPVLRLFLFGDE
ncbi:MAG: hypothetical protein AAFW68_00180 [Pseudomonadota bacterium]